MPSTPDRILSSCHELHDNQTWKVQTLKSITRMVGHQGRVIGVLKLDIEVYEWDIVDNLTETEMIKFIRQS